jgi:cystathionine beta-lyase/cystathionine gamma-synthase
MSGVIDEDGMYTRKTHKAQIECSAKLHELYPGSLAVQIVPSGTAAIYTAVHGAIDISKKKKKIKPGELILYASELYSETHRFFTELPNSREVDITVAVDEPIMQLLTSIARHTPVIYFVETHSNPHGIRPNVDFLKFLSKQFQNLQVISAARGPIILYFFAE